MTAPQPRPQQAGTPPPAPHPPGRHWLAELHGAEAGRLRDRESGRRVLRRALTTAGFTILGEQFHTFPGGGYTALFLLAESHASIHTWPELGYAAVDLFTCGPHDGSAVVDAVAAALRARDIATVVQTRGPRHSPDPPGDAQARH